MLHLQYDQKSLKCNTFFFLFKNLINRKLKNPLILWKNNIGFEKHHQSDSKSILDIYKSHVTRISHTKVSLNFSTCTSPFPLDCSKYSASKSWLRALSNPLPVHCLFKSPFNPKRERSSMQRCYDKFFFSGFQTNNLSQKIKSDSVCKRTLDWSWTPSGIFQFQCRILSMTIWCSNHHRSIIQRS